MKLNKLIFISAILLSFVKMLYQFESDKSVDIIWAAIIFLVGHNIFIKTISDFKKKEFFSEFSLMSIATVGAFILGEYIEAALIPIIYNLGELSQSYAVKKAKKDIQNLKQSKLKEVERIDEDGKLLLVSPLKIEINDRIIIKSGDLIPVDGTVENGKGYVDISSITGEVIPIYVKEGDEVISGSICKDTSLVIKASKKFKDSNYGKILATIDEASFNKSKYEKFITRFAKKYVPFVALAAIITLIFPYFIVENYVFSDWFYRSLVILMISCPCAFLVSIPLSYFLGLGLMAKRRIICKGGEFIDILAKTNKVFFDKTGTLTEGKIYIVSVQGFNGFAREDVLTEAQIAESISRHPIAKAICENVMICDYENFEAKEFPGEGIIANYNDNKIIVGSKKFLIKNKIDAPDLPETEFIEVWVAKNGKFIGRILLDDKLKKDSLCIGERLKKLKIKKVALLTGDTKIKAKKICELICGDEYHAELKPLDKVSVLEKEKENMNGSLIFVGDGINDAAAIAKADVGISLGKYGADITIETADIAILDGSPEKVTETILLSKKIFSIVVQNTSIAIGIKLLIFILGVFGEAHIWQAILADVGATLIVVFNSLRLMRA